MSHSALQRKKKERWQPVAAGCIAALVLSLAPALPAAEGLAPQLPPVGSTEPAVAAKPFTVGYIRPEATDPLTADWFRRLQDFFVRHLLGVEPRGK